jgi:hypothetical protein
MTAYGEDKTPAGKAQTGISAAGAFGPENRASRDASGCDDGPPL